MKGLKRYFITGLLVVVPLYLTFYVLLIIIRAMDNALNFLPEILRPQSYMPFHIPGIGIVFTVTGILLVGLLTQNFFGRKLVDFGEMLLAKIPFLRIVYHASKQFLETFFTRDHEGFSQVVIFEYPRKGIYTMGFVTGKTRGELKRKTGEKTTSIFLPTTPNPTSGFFIMVPDTDVIPMDMSVEDAFKVIMTGGIIEPEDYGVEGGTKNTGAKKRKSKKT